MTLLQSASQLQMENESFVMVTLVSTRGEAPQDPGAKIIVTKDGLKEGTIGGGKVEAAAIKKAQEQLATNKQPQPELITWNLQTDIGMTCGGEVTFLFEFFFAHNWPIIIFGAGHVAQALTRTLINLPCQVTCIDHRSEWINQLDSKTKSMTHANPSQLVKEFSPNSYFICMTQGHAHDVPILKAIFEHAPDCPYVGVIGSAIKGKRIKNELLEMGVSQAFCEKLKVPIGLPIGSNHPYEIAISITAQLLEIRQLTK